MRFNGAKQLFNICTLSKLTTLNKELMEMVTFKTEIYGQKAKMFYKAIDKN